MKILEFKVQDISQTRFGLHELLVPSSKIGLKIEDVSFVKPIYVRLQLTRREDEVYVQGNASASIEIECRRCAELFETEIEASMEFQFYQTDKANQIDSDLLDVGERYYSGDFIDLSEDVRQSLTLEVPIWAVCSELCKGLCPRCGENLNIADCSCHEFEESSSPFAVLANLSDASNRAVGNES